MSPRSIAFYKRIDMPSQIRLDRIAFPSALGASVVAGAMAGSLTAIVFSTVSALQYTLWWLVQTAAGASLAAVVGGVIALLPGLLIALSLQLLALIRVAFLVGAAVGILLSFAAVAVFFNTPDTQSHVLLAVCWALGGGVGGLALDRWSEPELYQ